MINGKNCTYVTLEQLEELFSQDGYICFGHGTGRKGNSDEVVDEIFSKGLRTKDNSLYFTAILKNPPVNLKSHLFETAQCLKTRIKIIS